MYDKDASEQTGNHWYDEGRFVLFLVVAGMVLVALFD